MLIIKKLSDGESALSSTYEADQNSLNMAQLTQFISYSANVLYNISMRTTEVESLDLVTSYSSLVDKFLNESLEVLRICHETDQSAKKYIFYRTKTVI